MSGLSSYFWKAGFMTRKSLLIVPKVIAVWLVLTICYIAGTFLSGLNRPIETPPSAVAQTAPQDPVKLLLTLLFVCLLIALVSSFIIVRSRGGGWKLVGALFLAMYGVMTVITQIETLIYLRHRMPPGLIAKLFLMGAIVAALFAPLAVSVLGKMRAEDAGEKSWQPLKRIPVRLLVAGIIYVILYFVFGYYVAWKNPVLREYYGGTDPGSFLAHMRFVWNASPWMFPFQIVRGALWASFVLPLIRVIKRSRFETIIAMALFSSIWSSILLFPNQLMPATVAHSHLVETFWSNLLFGAALGFLFTSKFDPLPQRPDNLASPNVSG
jgi:hypothetical protein